MESQAVKSISLDSLTKKIKNKTIQTRPDYQSNENLEQENIIKALMKENVKLSDSANQ